MENLNEGIDNPKAAVFIQHIVTGEFDSPEFRYQKARLIYAEGGVIHIFTEGKHWYLPGRFFMWIPAGIPHRILTHSPHVTLFSFYFTVAPEDDGFYTLANIYLVNDLLREMILFTKGWSGSVYKSDEMKFAFTEAIKKILPAINPAAAPFPVKHPYPKDPRLLEIAKFLKKEIDTPYSIEEVAKQFGYSTRTLSRLFKDSMGLSYVRFLRSVRISVALELMAEHQYSINEIAFKVGYNSLSSFSNIFFRVLGIRPGEYMARTNAYKKVN